MAATRSVLLSWTTALPVVALVVLAATWGRKPPVVLAVIVALVLAGAVLAAVHHAEVVAHRVGEPFGSLVLAVAVTIIEVALIVTLMVSGGPETATLARDTVFAAAMITCNGIVGLSLLLGARRYGLAVFNAEGSGAALATVATVATMSLVLPTFTTSRPGPQFSPSQLAFAAVASLVLYGAFVLTQTVRHRDFFLPVPAAGTVDSPEEHAEPPTARAATASLLLLLVALVAVVGLAKVESPAIEVGVAAVGFPPSFVGVVIALLVLLPETDRCGPGRPAQPAPDQPEPGPRLGAGQHRPDHPDHRGRVHLAGGSSAARTRPDADGPAGPHRRRRGTHRGPRPGDPPAGRRAPGAARGLPVPRRQPLMTEARGVARRIAPVSGRGGRRRASIRRSTSAR
jgi:Ca2+:H+ antiporter